MKASRFAIAAFLVFVTAAGAAQGRTLCSPPLPDDCIQPRWGEVQPDGIEPGASARDFTGAPMHASSANSAGQVRLMQAAAESASSGPGPRKTVAPRLLIDDGARFVRETRALIDAIRRASFDRNGKLLSGARPIEEAVERVRRVSTGYELTLYLKAPRDLKRFDRKALRNAVFVINEILEAKPGRPPTYPKGR